ncbi:thioredoxin [Tilletiaria anomala UBC 951]|uniref:Thioredoxin n=1 Tax=Tilletiaria anomala (strain ATCC 24038 / CBS 436.72 / UBC 951) TaxID=1037660 RepID=A0A066WGF8_TILAU|nr:thioredoxin [Tilletiaria anomala UBC 951]KDN52836.1 thioredoxin [Tilletiaria anomala UBC 951]
MGVKPLESLKEFQDAIQGDKVVVIDFWATWCGPCKMVSPIFEKLSEGAAADKVGFYKVDVDEQEQIAQEVKVKVMPTFMFFKGGQKIHEIQGARIPELTKAISDYSS